MDDKGDPGTGLTAAQTLINSDHVVALVGNAGGSDLAWAPVVSAKHVPAIGAIAYTSAWITNPLFYAVGPQITGTIFASMYALAQIGHVKKVGLLLCNQAAVCNSVVPLYQTYAKRLGIELTTIVRASVTQPSYTADCLTLQQSGATAVIVASPPIQKVSSDCAAQGYRPRFNSTEGAGVTPTIAKTSPGLNGYVAGLGAFPAFKEYPETATFFDAIRTYNPAYLNNPTQRDLFISGALGLTTAAPLTWASAVAFGKAVLNANVPPSSPVTSADIIRGLSLFHNETLGGIIPPHTFGDGTTPNPPSPCFYAMQIVNGQYMAPQGMTPYCASVADESATPNG
jgi:branched-chain amino acid transport system substrate-binding protein